MRNENDVNFGYARMLHFVYCCIEEVSEFFDMLDEDRFDEAAELINNFPDEMQKSFRGFLMLYFKSLKKYGVVTEEGKKEWGSKNLWDIFLDMESE